MSSCVVGVCSYLTHGYKCVADTALTCSLGQEFARSSAQHYTDIKAMCEGKQDYLFFFQTVLASLTPVIIIIIIKLLLFIAFI